MPTLEEFISIIKEYFQSAWRNLSTDQVDEYINEEEAQEVITHRYNEAAEEFKSGKITENIFKVGVASSVANCLAYMY